MKRETILIVEDCDMVRRFIRDVLRDAGYRVLEAPDGRAALRITTQFRRAIDLLVSDITMPDLDGLELSRHLSDQRPGIPVLLVSGFSMDAPVQHIPFLAKPFTPEQLLRKVNGLLAKRADRAETCPAI